MKRKRVVVTGLGVVSSIGTGWEAYWESLMVGRSGISKITAFDTAGFPTHQGGEIKSFHPEAFVDPPKLRRFNRASKFAIAATKMALEDARLSPAQFSPERIGIAIGTTMAEAQAIETMDAIWIEQDEDSIRPNFILQYPGNVIAANVATEFELKGPNIVMGTACSAGNYALAYAFDLLRLGKADIMIAGGSDAFSRIAFMGFNRLLAVAPNRCQPFDKNRKGMMVGEGTGIIVLERSEDALARRATIRAEILGYDLSCDANHMTIPSIEGVKNVMVNALRDADLVPNDVDYINAHGTGTLANDRTESAAIRNVFGPHTDYLPVSSTKSMIGHAMGAASALEAIACVLAIQNKRVPPTINFETPDPECPIDCVPNVSRQHHVRIALNNSFAFGGNNACLVFKAVS